MYYTSTSSFVCDTRTYAIWCTIPIMNISVKTVETHISKTLLIILDTWSRWGRPMGGGGGSKRVLPPSWGV